MELMSAIRNGSVVVILQPWPQSGASFRLSLLFSISTCYFSCLAFEPGTKGNGFQFDTGLRPRGITGGLE